MSTLESQYKRYLRENPGKTPTFEEWKKQLGKNLSEAWDRLQEKQKEKK